MNSKTSFLSVFLGWVLYFSQFIPSSSIGGAILITNCDDSGTGSLREAINLANSNTGPDTILFAIPKGVSGNNEGLGIWTIAPKTQLPEVTGESLVINGFSQADFIGEDCNPYGPEVVIDGANIGQQYLAGLKIKSSEMIFIYGLTISNFYGYGIWLDHVEGGHIGGCYIGIDCAGSAAAPNGYGIIIQNSMNVHFAPFDYFKNVISGNTNSGIFVSDTSRHIRILGNIIGLNSEANTVISNGNYGGIYIVGKCDSIEVCDNRICGNQHGIGISESSFNMIVNNWIGSVPENPGMKLANKGNGIFIGGASHANQILENHIWFNQGIGVYIHGTEHFGNRISHNSISHNNSDGIYYHSGTPVVSQPVITSVTGSSVSGTAVANGFVEIYTDSLDQGEYFQGETMSDASGQFTWNGTIQGPYNHVTAIAIDTAGNTSCFSKALVITNVVMLKDNQIPKTFVFYQNYPNPFNPTTVIRYEIPEPVHVNISVFNLMGQELAVLENEKKIPGCYTVQWDGTDKNNQKVSAGIYLVTIRSGSFKKTGKMVLIK